MNSLSPQKRNLDEDDDSPQSSGFKPSIPDSKNKRFSETSEGLSSVSDIKSKVRDQKVKIFEGKLGEKEIKEENDSDSSKSFEFNNSPAAKTQKKTKNKHKQKEKVETGISLANSSGS